MHQKADFLRKMIVRIQYSLLLNFKDRWSHISLRKSAVFPNVESRQLKSGCS